MTDRRHRFPGLCDADQWQSVRWRDRLLVCYSLQQEKSAGDAGALIDKQQPCNRNAIYGST
jgi:hypothetical protein